MPALNRQKTGRYLYWSQRAMAYIMYEDQHLSLPDPDYYRNIEEAYKKFGFNTGILKKAYQESS